MKLRFIISILFLCLNTKIFANISIEDTLHQANINQQESVVDNLNASPGNPSKDYGGLSQASFSDKNWNLALYTVFVAVIGTLLGIIASMSIAARNNQRDDIRGFKEDLKKELAKQINEQNNQIQERIGEANRIRNDIETRTNGIERILRQQNYQIQYLERINRYLFSITNSIVDSDGGNSESTLAFRNSLYNQYYIVKTFLPWSDGPTDSTQAAFMYLQYNGTLDNIDDLQFIAANDPDERKKNKARETIGFIRARLESDQVS